MTLSLNYPGVYVQELPPAEHTVTGVATSITAFIGRAWSGPANQPVTISSFADYVRQFGGLWRDSTMSYAVQQFFDNGGSEAIIVRVVGSGATVATYTVAPRTFKAASEGSWGRNLKITVDTQHTADSSDGTLFSLTVVDDSAAKTDARKVGGSGATEQFLNVSFDPASPRYVKTVLEQESQLLRVDPGSADPPDPAAPTASPVFTDGTGNDGQTVSSNDLAGDEDARVGGLYALESADLFNILCIPPKDPDGDNDQSLWSSAARYCQERRAILVIDAPSKWTVADAKANVAGLLNGFVYPDYAAVYFPRVMLPDPLQENKLRDFAPCGVVAGVYARTDGERGVWKAPAGTEAVLGGVSALAVKQQPANLTNADIGTLNPLGVNCLRVMPVYGPVVWGSRTLDGADNRGSQWKYVPVRRLALYIEESLFRSTQWVVFEPNDEPLWSQIRLDVGAFMQTLFRQGAFQGESANEAYFVRCSSETTTQADIDAGRVNIVVGFAPLKPAEFVVLQIQQKTQQL